MKKLRFALLCAISIWQISFAQTDCPIVLTANNAAANNQFGRSVAFAGQNYLLTGAMTNEHGEKSGSVYVFKKTDTNW